jgi:hypothetical protein
VSETENEALLENLSDSDKDELILRLWRDLRDERAHAKTLEERLAEIEGTGPAASSLLKQLQAASVDGNRSKPTAVARSGGLGSWCNVLGSTFLFVLASAVAIVFAADYAIGKYQSFRVGQDQLAALQLQHAAYEGLFVELAKVDYEPDQKSYRVTMKMTNIEPDRPVYIMQTPLRVFEQSGLAWKEVPSHAPNGETANVVKLVGPHLYETIFEPNLKDWAELIPGYMHIRYWAELIPGYMHIRLQSSSLVSQRSDPDDDIVERVDRYYVYLKPHGADDDAIRRRMNYKGEPPVYMPMPPH